MQIEVKNGKVVFSEMYNGIGIKTEAGDFGVAQRDGGIEIMLNGELVFGYYSKECGDGPHWYSKEPKK